MTTSEDILNRNESEANLLAGNLMLIICVISVVLILLLLILGSFIPFDLLLPLLISGNIIRILLFLLIRQRKGRGPNLKWIITLYILSLASIVSTLFGQMEWVFFAGPILIATRYYDVRFTLKIGAITILWAIVFSFCLIPISIYSGLIDLNLAEFGEEVILNVPAGFLGLNKAVNGAVANLDLTSIFGTVAMFDLKATLILSVQVILAALIAKSGRQIIKNEITAVSAIAQQKSNDLDILDALADNINELYFINPYTSTFTHVVRNKNKYLEALAKYFIFSEDFFESVAKNIEPHVHELDRNACRRFFSKENFMHIFVTGEPKIIEARWLFSGEVFWVRSKAILGYDKNGDKSVVLSVEEISPEKETQKMTSVLASLAGDFDYISHINIENNEVTRIHTSARFLQEIISIDHKTPPSTFSVDNFNIFMSKIIHPDDLPDFLKDGMNMTFLQLLRKEKIIQFRCRVRMDGGFSWHNAKIIIDENNPSSYVVGLMDINEIVKSEKEQVNRAVYENARTFAKAFTQRYAVAYYADLANKSVTTFQGEKVTDRYYDGSLTYMESAENFIMENIHEDDRARIIQYIQPDYIRPRLEKEGSYSTTFRDISTTPCKLFRIEIFWGLDKDHAVFAISDITDKSSEEAQG